MQNLKMLIILLLIGTVIRPAIAQEKIPITKADDLPRRSVSLEGKAVEIVEDIPQLDRLNDQLIANLEADLRKYDIQDKATLIAYHSSLAASYAFRKDYKQALKLLEIIRELEDKESEKLTTGLYLKAFVKTLEQHHDHHTEAFKQFFTEQYRQLWSELPYEKVKDEVERMRGSMSVFNPNLITAGLEGQLQPFLDNNKNVVPEGIITNFIGIRLTLDYRAELIPQMLGVLNELYEEHKDNAEQQNIWEGRNAIVTPDEAGSPVVVVIWDSGTDLEVFPKSQIHRDENGKNGIGYSLIDYKKDGLLLEDPTGKIQSDLDRLQRLTKGYLDLQAAVESPEVTMIRQTIAGLQPEEVKSFQEELSFYGNYAHGTHVAGIALKDNPFAKLLVVRMGFDYRTLPPAHTMENTQFQAAMYGEIVDYLKANGVRVVNMSWRYGVAAYEGLLTLNGVGKDEEERKQMAREMFEIEKKALYEAIRSAPEILFVCGSGNENNDAGFVEYIPASFHDLPNLITIGAVDKAGKKTSFTTEGKSVRFYADGFEVESFVPGGDRVKFSGTSMASPQVVNLAAKMLALAPELRPEEVIEWIAKGADYLPEDPDLLLIHPRNTLELLTGKTRNDINTGLLLRKWSPDEATAGHMVQAYIDQVKKQSGAQAEALISQQEMLRQMFSQITIEYKSDGSVVITVPGSPAQNGEWEFESGENRLINRIGGQSDFEVIRSLSAGELRTTNSDGVDYRYVSQD